MELTIKVGSFCLINTSDLKFQKGITVRKFLTTNSQNTKSQNLCYTTQKKKLHSKKNVLNLHRNNQEPTTYRNFYY